MKKKVFSLMMTLFLAFIGVAKAEVVTIGEGTSTTYVTPYNSLWGYSFVEQIFTADEIGTAGTITAISFNLRESDAAQTNAIDVFMKNVTRTEFSATTDYETVEASDMVFSGTVTFSPGWTTITLDTPFEYDGTSNLMIGMHEYTSGYSTRYFYYTSATNKVITFHSDSYNPDPYNLGSFSGSKYTSPNRSNIQIDITPGGGGGGETQLVTIGEGTNTYYYYPVNMYFNYSMTEQIYTADEIGTGAGTINSVAFYYDYTNSFSMDNVKFYMKNVTRDAFASNTDMESLAAGDLVWTGTLSATEAGWVTVTLDTPFAYTGGNLLIAAFDGTSGYPGSAYKWRTSPCEGYKGINWYSDSYIPEPYNTASGFSGSKSYTQYRNNIQLSITTGGGGGGGGFEDQLHVKYMDGEDEIIDQLNLGVRPVGCWMEPFHFTMYTDGPNYRVNILDFTPSDGMFIVEGEELPFNVRPDEDVELFMSTSEEANHAGVIERQFVAITEGNRAAHIWPVVVEMYEPAVPDVVELAYDLGTIDAGFSYAGDPAQITPTTLHNDYTLPFPEILEGEDAVYKFTVEGDVILNAWVDENADNGKVALYREGFEGEGGPMATNNYTGLVAGGGAAAAPFEAQIGEGTSTTGYFPFYTLYNYSISENLFLATELAEAGVTSAPMTSLSWYATNAPGYAQQGISIWMANVEDEALTTTSHPVTGMTLVYTGSMTPAIGWNEFEFNEGTFSWDGHSNVLIFCQRNNGEWNSTVSWQATSAMGFNCMAYRYQDSGAYDPTVANTMYTSTVRPNIIMKGGNRGNRANRNEVTYDFENSLQGWTVMNIEEDEGEWVHSSDNPGGYDYTELAHSGTGFAMSYSYVDYVGEFNTDSYLISPQKYSLGENATLTFFYDFANDSYPDYFEVGVATDNEPDEYSFDYLWSIDDERGHSHSNATVRHINNRYENWREVTIDLSDYAGEDVWITFHHQDMDMYEVWIDDVTISGVAGAPSIFSAGPVIEGLPLTAGTYYLVTSATLEGEPNGGGNGMTPEDGRANDDPEGYMVYINVENMPCPAIEAEGFAFNPQPADNEDELEPAHVTLRWMVPDYATGWRLIFGSTYHPEPGHPQTIMYPEDGSFSNDMANSYTVRNLWNNTNYFWHVEFNNDDCPEGVSSPIWGFTTHLNVPQNLTAVDETVFNDETITLNWNAVVDRTYRQYNVYRDGELIGHTTVNNISNTTYTDGPLAYNMEGYTYYVTAVYDEGESAPSNTVNVKVSGYGDVNGHVYEQDGETGIAGATVTMVGRDEFNVNHTYNFQTNAQGYYTGHIYAGAAYDGQAAKDGYQTATVPVQGEPIVIDYNETTSPIDYILDENFDPVCGVIAEYYPDSLDPASPYVKVYWGCGLPGSEIIEDFETGDFSMFDWQLDPTYPWSITTNNPYEGTYCMKSGGAGVANVVSNMSVTVDIPADGIMSFFGKISCESSWDYGYFYIDGVQKGSYTGAGSWGEKKFDITAGTHTFKWSYTKDSSVNSNDDCFYVDYITFFKTPEPAQPGWHTYLESEFDNAYRSNVGDPQWGYEYPTSVVSQFAGWQLTKVAVFSDSMYGAVGGNFTCNVYVGGSTPGAGTLASTITVDVPVGLGDWCEYDLTTPVNVTGSEPIWVIWAVNTYGGMGYPAGCASHSSAYGDWWNNGQDGWGHMDGATWTMKNYFTNRSGRSVVMTDADCAPVAVESPVTVKSNLRTYAKGVEDNTAECINPNAVQGARLVNNATRSLDHYRVYRTNCYNDGPYTEENTVLLATVWVPDTVYIDVEWADLPAGVYKWGVGAVYSGNRGEEIEAPINWAAPVAITRDATADNDPNPVPGEEGVRAPWDLITTFNAPEGGHYGVVTDGQYIYTSNWGYSSAAHNFYKYDMQGNMIEGFEIPGCGTLRGMTFDGQYVYGVANSSTVYCVDLNSHTLVNTFTSAYGAMRGITYDPERDGFWVIGNWSGNLTLINRTGAVQFAGPAPTSASDLAYYEDEDGVEHVYCFNNADNGVYDYNITTNTLGGSVFNFSATPGFDNGSSGGCHVAEYNGTMAFFGDIQQSPNLIGIYELRDAAPSPTPGPGGDNLNQLALPRESETIWSNCLDKDMYLSDGELDITVLLNSADSPEGVVVSFENYNEGEQELYPMDDVIIDETGYYAWDSFRKGEYQVTLTLDGYETIVDSVSIWDPTSLRYVMIEIIYGVSDLYVSSTGWAMWGAQGSPVGPIPGPGGEGDEFTYDFDNGSLGDWTTIDADGDGLTWVSSANPGVYHNSGVNLSGTGHNASEAYVISGSYANQTGQVLYPDNYLVSPLVNLVNGSTFTFWACAQDASYAAEHFGVSVSDNGTDWTLVQEWTMTAKGTGAMSYGRDGNNRAQGNWYQKTVDLSAYAGQKYIAIRHFNCYDQFILNVDDVELAVASKDGGRHLEAFKVMCTSIDGEPIFNTNVPADQPFCQVATEDLEEGEHYICKVAAIYSTGMSGWTECEWQYIPCENYAGTLNGTTLEGNTISWEYPNGTGPTPPGQGDTFSVNFDDSQMPAGWTIIDGGNPTGYGWQIGSTKLGGTGNGHNGSADLILSQSYDNSYGVVYPDNWFISPAVTLTNGSTFSLWACGQDASYAAEHFGVFVSTTGTNPSDFQLVQEWTLSAKDGGNGHMSIGRDGQMRDQGNWYQKTVDLSSFAGAGRYIAVRHFNCSDMFYLDVDDLELTIGTKGNRAEWTFANGFVTDPGAMNNGGDASWIKGTQSTFGPGCQQGNNNWVADSFTVDAATTIDEITVYGYQTGSSTTSTFTGLYVQIYNGNPMSGGTVVWGSSTSNIMTATAFTNCYRGSDGDASGTTRPIMSITAGGLNIELEAGTYYLAYQLTGTGSSGPWGQPHAEPGVGNTGNGVQYLGSNNAWQNLTDSGSGAGYGIAMTLHGNQGSGPVPPTPGGDILGAMIFVDGEWEAFVPVPTNEYTYEGDGEFICVRMVYNGTDNLPEGNIYYSMSCPECEELIPGEYCEAGAPIHAEELHATDQVKIWWGEEPQPPMEEWLYYDDGVYATSVGAGGTVYWATMFPANAMAAYAGTSLTKVAVHTSYACSATVNVYLGGNTPTGSPVATQTFSMPGDQEFTEITLNNPVAIDGTQNLWIMFYQSGETYPADACADTGDANNRWVSLDGNTWYDLAEAGLPGYGWMIRGFVTNQAKGGEIVSLPEFKGNVGTALSHTEVVSKPADLSFMNRAAAVQFNVYRSTDNDVYNYIGSVPYVEGQPYYEFIDTPEEAGMYYYQVTLEYDNDCESAPAEAFDNPAQDYVTATVTGMGENDSNVALYPNPTSGNVTIEAAGMSRITVVSVLGQVVFDAEVNADNYTLNMGQFNAGMYMVRIYSESGVSIKRVTVIE